MCVAPWVNAWLICPWFPLGRVFPWKYEEARSRGNLEKHVALASFRSEQPKIRNLEAGIWNLEVGTQNLEAGIWNLEPGGGTAVFPAFGQGSFEQLQWNLTIFPGTPLLAPSTFGIRQCCKRGRKMLCPA
ncbi:hypothetical protein DY000_02033074 [Brassica cretica]|uniref:Uncharacterized protein n=1 Tax=Brassica cretica TaxID=69181 RepID=A0ABQ7DGT3_BRACR|nr:hypothetical protein DY000_02033074 [Brassica cretica]